MTVLCRNQVGLISHCDVKLAGYLKYIAALSLPKEILEKQISQTTCPVRCWKTIHPCLFCRVFCVRISRGHRSLWAGMGVSPGDPNITTLSPCPCSVQPAFLENHQAGAVCALELQAVPQRAVSSHLYLLCRSSELPAAQLLPSVSTAVMGEENEPVQRASAGNCHFETWGNWNLGLAKNSLICAGKHQTPQVQWRVWYDK